MTYVFIGRSQRGREGETSPIDRFAPQMPETVEAGPRESVVVESTQVYPDAEYYNHIRTSVFILKSYLSLAYLI